jgi:hypothetical protein
MGRRTGSTVHSHQFTQARQSACANVHQHARRSPKPYERAARARAHTPTASPECAPAPPDPVRRRAEPEGAAPRRRHTLARTTPCRRREDHAERACEGRSNYTRCGTRAVAPAKASQDATSPASAAPQPCRLITSAQALRSSARGARARAHRPTARRSLSLPRPTPRRARGAAPKRRSPTVARRTFEEPPAACRERARRCQVSKP